MRHAINFLQIDIQTGNEYADEEPSQSKAQAILQTYQQLKTSKATQQNFPEPIVGCNEIEEENIANELITNHNDSQVVINGKDNSRNSTHVHKQPSADISQVKLQKSYVLENSHDSQNLQNFAKNGQIPSLTNNISQLTRKYCSHCCTKKAEYYHPTCSHQISHCSLPFNLNEKQHTCERYCNVYGNMVWNIFSNYFLKLTNSL